MKIGVIPSQGTIYGLIDHLNNVQLGDTDVDALMVEHVQTPLVDGKSYINTSRGLQTFLVVDAVREPYLKALDYTPRAKEVSALYCLFNGKDFSDWLELSYSKRLMNNDVGPEFSFITGVGLKPNCVVEEAVKGIDALKQLLLDTEYKGEVYIGITKDYKICNIKFGHLYSCFAMFYEICENKRCDGVLGFLLGDTNECKLSDHIVVSNIISKAPFPYMQKKTSSYTLPNITEASKQTWNISNKLCTYALIVSKGEYLSEARRRLRRTLYNMAKYDTELQYRTDYGLRREFVLSRERYKELADRCR